jgi:16S rRNA (guanine966-N2)-methyltransferase
MTRIIGGSAGGRRLKAPSGDRTRPTSDRVREALFSSLDADLGSLAGLRFLDLYAGSGAVGLEARSRGAGVVTLVEQDRRTAALIRDNLRSLGFSQVEVVAGAVSRVLAASPRAPYDVVFLDPPYTLGDDEVVADLRALLEHRWLAEGAVVVVERSSRSGAPVWPDGLVPARSRKYGETTLWYGHAPEQDDLQVPAPAP